MIGKIFKRFTIDTELLQRLGLDSNNYIQLNMESVQKFVFATGADKTHFTPSLETVASIQKLHPRKTILYYDLGLTASQIIQVNLFYV